MLGNRTMTVGQLKQALANFEDDMLVVVQGDYGDRINTPEAIWVKEPEEAYLTKTRYSKTGWRVTEPGSFDLEEDSLRVVVLSYEERY